jgi:hypothetical protein
MLHNILINLLLIFYVPKWYKTCENGYHDWGEYKLKYPTLKEGECTFQYRICQKCKIKEEHFCGYW